MATSQEAVRRLTIVTSAPGADQAAASLRGVSKAMDGVTVASQSQEKAALSLDQKFASIERRYVSQVRAQQDFEKIQKQVNAAVAQNPALQERANVILAAAKDRHDQLSNSQKALATVAQDLSARAQALSGSFGAVGSALMALGPAGIAAGVTIGALILGFHQAADAALRLAERAGKLKDFSETTGFTVVQLQALEKAGAQVGVSAESVSRGLERFSVAMDDMKKGTGPAFETILEINPALAEQLTKVNSLTDAWDIFSKAIKASDLEQANKLARSVFGRSGVEITRLARANADAGGTAGVVGQLKEVDRITTAQTERWDELSDKIAENMKAAKQNIASIFTEPVLNALNTFSEGFLALSRVAKEFTISDELKFLLQWTAAAAAGPAFIGAKIGGLIRGAERAPAANDNTLSFNDRYANAPTGQAVSLDTVRLDAQKRAMSVNIAEQERWNAAMGAAVTPAANLKLSIDKIKLAALENKISTEQSATAQAALNAQYNSSQFSTYIGLLGQAASIEEQVQAKRNQINDATRQGIKLTDDQIANQLRLTRSQADGTFQMDAASAAEKIRIDTLGMSTEKATAYAIVQTKINEAIAVGRPLTADQIAELQRSADAFATVKKKADDYAQIFDTLRSGAASFGSDLVANLRKGESAMTAIGHAAQNLSTMLTNSAITNLLSGNFIGAAVSGIGAVISGIFGNNQRRRDEEEAAARASAERVVQYAQRTQLAGIDTSTRAGSLASQEIQFQSERAQEAQNGNRALMALLTAQDAERRALQQEWDRKDIEAAKAKQEAIDARVQTSSDRLFAAMNDNSTLEGQLAAADRQFLKERIEEMKVGGEALNDLVAAQEAERIDIIKKYNDELLKFVQGVAKTIRDYLQGLKTGSNSILSPQDQLAAAQSNFTTQIGLARGGDRDALSGITQVAQTLLDQARSFFASSSGYTSIYDQVTAALTGVADISTATVSDADKIVAAVNDSKTVTSGTIQTTSLQEQSILGAINVLADRFTNSINSLGVLNQNIGNTHTNQFAAMISLLGVIAARPQAAATTLWSFLGFAGGGVIPGYAGGGMVGNGIYGVDSVRARYAGGGDIALAGGEYVMPANQTRQYRPQLDAMRSGTANDNGDYFAALARTNASGFSAICAELRELRQAVYGGAKMQVDAVKQRPAQRPGVKSAAAG